MKRSRILPALFATAALLLSGCGGQDKAEAGTAAQRVGQLNIDFATYNPLSLVVKEKGWLEEALPGVKINWVQSAGSNKANENLRAGAVDIGSTAGASALLARSNGSPIKAIDVFGQPEWTALVVRKDSPIKDVKGLVGKKVAVTKGTDPYFFLLQSLDKFGVQHSDVTIVNLQHADGRVALENGSVDAWSGLDPIMATSQALAGSKLIYRNVDFATYGFLNATEGFLGKDPATAQVVVDAYERARAWAKDNPDELAQILAKAAAIDVGIAKATLKRTRLDIDSVPGAAQRTVLERVGPIFVGSGDVRDQGSVDAALAGLFQPEFAQKAKTPAPAGK